MGLRCPAREPCGPTRARHGQGATADLVGLTIAEIADRYEFDEALARVRTEYQADLEPDEQERLR